MRAHVFLDALERGEPLDDANGISRILIALTSSKGIMHLARMRMHGEFNGRWLSLIQGAYDRGVEPKLTPYEREFFELKLRPSTPAVGTPAPTLSWVRSFVLFYVCDSVGLEGTWSDGTPKMTERLRGLLNGKVSSEAQMSLSASLRLYMAFAYSHIQRFDIMPVVSDARIFLTETITARGAAFLPATTKPPTHRFSHAGRGTGGVCWCVP